MKNTFSDQAIRIKALDPRASFIVQAPAGSGKTELLTQRYLRLLAECHKAPEEIIAITFTRKAAAEMRTRIFNALLSALNPAPTATHQLITWQLAKKAMEQNLSKGWQLEKNPNRLRIITIDSLTAMLNKQLPLLSGFGASPRITPDATPYYREAIQQLLKQNDLSITPHLQQILLHLDNQSEQLIQLMMNLLEKRDQWLPYIIEYFREPEKLKSHLENSLQNIILEKITTAHKLLSPYCQEPIFEIFIYLKILNEPHLPPSDFKYLKTWQVIANVLLTQTGKWRKKVDKRQGFHLEEKFFKKRFLEWMEIISENNALNEALNELQTSPLPYYLFSQWETVHALIAILPILVAHLHLIFRQYASIDFVELNLGALRALGSMDQPSDLALSLDYQISHILVDEFQDTSFIQFRLLETLVSSWAPEEGKTLFLVGDPMQSIYRFRNAEVGLFLRAQEKGIAQIPLIPLNLSSNFRSRACLIHWINETFTQIFPAVPSLTKGAVPYSCAYAMQEDKELFEPVDYIITENEAESIIALIHNLQQKSPENSIAILVRSRSHLTFLLKTLQQAKIEYQAIDIENLANSVIIRDLIILTRALLHPGDRIAWLALLRAPWCGLTLNDLWILTQIKQNPLWFTIKNKEYFSQISLHAQLRLEKIIPILEARLRDQGREPLAQWIKNTWLLLGGLSLCQNEYEKENVEIFFHLLTEFEHDFSLELLLEKIASHPIPSRSKAPLQIMTIHKAKGLEFDHVIIPGCHHTTRQSVNQLLMWLELPSIQKNPYLILAPLQKNFHDFDAIHNFIKTAEKTKLEYELARLFYVAVTRAKKSIHLVFDNKEPTKGSFLFLFWNDALKSSLPITATTNASSPPIPPSTIKRLPLSFEYPYQNASLLKDSGQKNNFFDFDLENICQRLLGTVIHEALKLASQNLTFNQCYWEHRLRQLGLPKDYLALYSPLITKAVENTLSDIRGKWILMNHEKAASEYALTALLDDRLMHFIIDRTFIENNIRWIIDYKTGSLKNASQYCAQLNQYAKVFAMKSNLPIKLGLYFPLCKNWVEWEFNQYGIETPLSSPTSGGE